jgi:LacI family transcriptional regulator
MSALIGLGANVPGDVAVAGFDDIVIARYITPALTTARVDVHGLGERAVNLLLSSRDTAGETLPVPLVVRRSCGAGGEAGGIERSAPS